jgi:hypothetical protein
LRVLGNSNCHGAVIFEPHPFVGFGVLTVAWNTHVFAPELNEICC